MRLNFQVDKFMSLAEKLARLDAEKHQLRSIKRGIEKESLRICPSGYLAKTRHPKALGSTLTHPYITTDYSEALLEFITPASSELDAPINWLEKIHRVTYQHINGEILWNASMPCVMEQEKDIPIAYYGESNVGKMKYVYREGLGWRYGRFMQTIAGVHYNFSLPENFWSLVLGETQDQQQRSEHYMGLIRNYLRFGWLIPYLFGASPALCKSFLRGHKTDLAELYPGTMYGKHATSLRMSDLGYQNNAQSFLKVSYNSLESYIAGLEHAIRTSEPMYEKIGTLVEGEYRQLNTNLLQIENEYYSSIRPKKNALSGERPTKALTRAGVEYIEVRALDINPFAPTGICKEQMAFMDAFLIYCALSESPAFTERTIAEYKENMRRVVNYGRDPELCLTRDNREVCFKAWANQLLEEIQPIACLLDEAYQDSRFTKALDTQKQRVANPELTLSGQVVAAIKQRGDSYFHFAKDMSERHKQQMLELQLSEAEQRLFNDAAQDSLQQQAQIEAKQTESFEAYVASYYA